jgi:thiol:disulfide interchange protein
MRTRVFYFAVILLASLFFSNINLFAQPVNKQIEKLIKRDSINELIISELKTELKKLKTPVTVSPDSSRSSDVEATGLPPAEQKALRNFKERGNGNEHTSLIYFLVFAFVSGLISLLTPCVFPMIPLTVTFFTNDSISRGQAIRKAIIYGVSIIFIFTVLGLLLGGSLGNLISTHWLPNIIFFALFLFFGLSFLGLFEITLPASFVNKVDRQADKGGYYGVFFMAFTLVVVSFSCTAPIVGALLVEAADGKLMKPILGMLSYSLAFAIPFALFAMFPSWLNALPKSGGWLNVIKVFLGFLELGLAFKFLSVADQVYHWNILDREIYIAIWIVISILLGVYFLGKIRLPHDSETHITTVPRLILSIICFVFAVYLLPGMFGAPLKAFSGYLPPMSTHDFDIPGIVREYSSASCGTTNKTICEEPKYGKGLKLPHGLKGYFYYKQAINCARERKLPVLIDFTGHGCVNCREMEANVWADPDVLKVLNNDYIIVALYVDDKTELPKSEWYESSYDHKVKKNLGAINSDIQASKFNTNAQPYYIILDPFTELPLAQPQGYDLSVPNFLDFLEEGKTNFKANKSK